MEDKKSTLILLKGTYEYSTKKRRYIFHLLDGDSVTSKTLKLIVDQIYDSTFKKLFGCQGAEERLKKMLNALLFPGENPKKIRKLKLLPNEIYKLKQKNNKNSLKPDITCEIQTDDNTYIINIKMKNEVSLKNKLNDE